MPAAVCWFVRDGYGRLCVRLRRGFSYWLPGSDASSTCRDSGGIDRHLSFVHELRSR